MAKVRSIFRQKDSLELAPISEPNETWEVDSRQKRGWHWWLAFRLGVENIVDLKFYVTIEANYTKWVILDQCVLHACGIPQSLEKKSKCTTPLITKSRENRMPIWNQFLYFYASMRGLGKLYNFSRNPILSEKLSETICGRILAPRLSNYLAKSANDSETVQCAHRMRSLTASLGRTFPKSYPMTKIWNVNTMDQCRVCTCYNLNMGDLIKARSIMMSFMVHFFPSADLVY